MKRINDGKSWARVLTTALAMLIAMPAAASGWQSVELPAKATKRPDGLLIEANGAALTVTALTPEIIRVRYVPNGKLGPDRSFAVQAMAGNAGKLDVMTTESESQLKTSALQVHIQHQPLQLEFLDNKGKSLDRDDETRGIAKAGAAFRVAKRLRDDEQVYGFGEKTGRLNKRGMGLGGYHYAMWNSDTYGYDMSIDPIYVSVPFYLVLRDGRAHGIFLDNSHRSFFDIGRESRGVLQFGADGGELDYYFIDGPDPKSVISRYTELTGRMPLPPRWALGYHQSRWSYFPEARLRLLADTFRSKQVPADTLWLDIDYLEGFTPFAWNKDYFPDPSGMIGDLRKQGFHVVTIVDPHPKKQAGYHVYDQGIAGNHFVKYPDGKIFEGPVWPINAAKQPANSVFPDFTRADTRKWWGDLHRELLEQGVAGIWNDMNEPAVWIPPANTMPLDVQHENDGVPTDQREIHNVYGMLHTRSTFEGLSRLRPDARPFVLTRATFAGGQRYAAVWPGDNTADWSSLRQSLPMLMGMGLSGFPFVGTDIGGFAGFPSAELYTRWLQAAVFAPFMRSHTEKATPDQEPWSFGAAHEAINKRSIELRYQWLPHIYAVMEEASRTGLPAMRPLFLEYPADPQTWSRDDEFMFGSNVLVAPVLIEGVTQREVYLPAGDWYDEATGQHHAGGTSHRIPVTLDSLPIFVRAGGFVYRQPTVQHTGEMPGQTLTIKVFPAPSSVDMYYEDDGESMQFQHGNYRRVSWHQQRDGKRIVLSRDAAQGGFSPAPRRLQLQLINVAAAKSVAVNGKLLERKDAAEFGKVAAAWTVTDNHLLVAMPDGNGSVKVEVRLP